MKNRRIYKPLAAIIVIGVLLFYIDTRESIVFSRLPKEVARSASRIGSRALAQQDIAFHLSFRKGGPFEWIGQESVIRSGVEVKSFDGLWGGSFDGHQRTFLLTDRNWLDLGESFSLSVLVKLDSSSDHQEIMFARAQGAQIGIKLDNGKMTFFVPGESGVQITYYDFAHYDELVMVTAVADADSSSISLYQNGKLMSSSAFHFTRGIQHPIAIGSRNWRAVRDPLHGVLFSATAWRRALHANEVASLCARNRVTPRDLSRQHYAAWRFYDMMENIMKASLSVLDYFSVFLHEGRVLDADLPELNLFVRNATLRSMNAHHQSSLMSGRRVAAAADPQKIAYAFENMVGDGLLLLEGGNDSYVTGKRPGYVLHTDSENPFMGLQNIRLLPPDEVGFLHPLLEAAVARRLGIPHIQNGFCILRINGTFVGVYYYEDYSTKGIVAGFSENLHLGPTHPHDWRSVFRDQVNRVYGLNRLALQDEIPLDAKELLSLYERLLDDKAGLLYNDLHSGISSREVKYRLRQYREKLHQIWPLASSELSRSRIYKDALREYLLLGSNPSPFYVISDLDLSVFHDRDIDITWESSDESVIGSQGKVRRPKDGVPVEVEMVAVIGCDRETLQKNLVFRVIPEKNSMPAIMLYVDNYLKKVSRQCAIIDYYENSSDSTVQRFYATQVNRGGVSHRGNTSYWEQRKAYSIRMDEPHYLLNETSTRHVHLISSPSDSSFMRNKLSYDIFKSFGSEDVPRYAPDIQLAELFVNGRFLGLYEMCTRVDRRLIGWDRFDPAQEYNALLLSHENVRVHTVGHPHNNMRQMYPPRRTGVFISEYLFLEDVFRYEDSSAFIREVDARFDMQNIVDFHLFWNFVENRNGWPHRFSVMELLAREPGPQGRFFFVPWDYDKAFVRRHEWYACNFMRRLQDEYPGYYDMLHARWKELRQGPLHLDALHARIDELGAHISGYADWTYALWRNDRGLTHNQHVDGLHDFVRRRIDYLDAELERRSSGK